MKPRARRGSTQVVKDSDISPSPEEKASRNFHPADLKILICVAGIYFFYIWYSIIQERITKSRYGAHNERFPSVLFLVLVQCLQAAFAGYLGMFFERKGSSDTTVSVDALRRCFVLAFSYVGAMVLSNMALEYVDYPTQVLSKSCKPIPVLLLGLAFNQASYSWRKYFYVLLITVGIAAFMYNPREDKAERQAHTLGYVFLSGSLLLDGITGPFQQRVFATTRLSRNLLMCFTNLFASAFLFVGVLMTGQLTAILDFFVRFPAVTLDVLLFSVLSSLGQLFIYYTVQHFGALTCTIVTTTRKFWTILASVLWFGHYLAPFQWFGVGLVFLGIILDTREERNSRSERGKSTQE